MLTKNKSDMGNFDALTKQFSRYLTGWAMSKAILEDYSKVISKLENTSKEEVQQRIMKKTQEHFDTAQKTIPKKE